jgi:hypothetical protein
VARLTSGARPSPPALRLARIVREVCIEKDEGTPSPGSLRRVACRLPVQHAPLTLGSKHPVLNVPGIDSVTLFVVSVIATFV